MRVGIDASRAFTRERTGTENYSYNLVKSLIKIDKRNHFILYLSPYCDDPFLEKLQVVSEVSNKLSNVSTRLIKLPRLWTQLGLAAECLVYPPDVLFVPAHALPVIRKPALKTIVTIHDLGNEDRRNFTSKFYLNWSTGYATRFATHIIAVSEFTKKNLLSRFSIDPERVTVIHEGFDDSLFKPVKDPGKKKEVKLKYGLGEKYLLFVGTIQPRKNLVRLIKAYSLLAGKKAGIDLVLVGKSGWLNEEIYKLPEKLNLADKVKFVNYVTDEDLPILYSSAEALVLPSLFEGFGLPVLEAMACECPVVTSNVSSLPEVGGEAVILVNPYDVDDIAAALYRVVTDNNLRNVLRSKGLKRVKTFSWDKCAAETLSVFEKVYAKR
jgi:glycosyltransferase involved in cell wall biosynthesis